MINRQLSVFTLGLVLLAASCKKTDSLYTQANNAQATKALTAAATTQAATWKTINQWNANKQDKFTTYSTQIEDSSITASVITKGLVLVYMNNGKGITSLPFQQKDGGEAFWYYQLAKNSLQINCDAYTAEIKPDASQLRYFVISQEKLQSLQQTGHTKKSLLTLTYDNAAALLK